MSLAEGVLQIVEDSARRERFGAVRVVRLEIGELAGVEVDALRFCFDVVARGGVAEGARLEIERTPGAAWCMQCAQTVPVAARLDPCPECGTHQLQVCAGTEMRVKDLEVT
jgi:hydrogenase nickel incorporation protein HypA/HybF